MDFRLGELFCGPGGIALAATSTKVQDKKESYSIKHEWATDYDKDTCETYRHNISPNNPKSVYCKDIRKLDIESLSPIDALAFGFPCNDFSMVGEQRGMNGVFGPLYSYGVQALKYFKPTWFLAENVGGLKSSNEGRAFQTIMDELEKAGYQITAHLYRFEEYEVPQARHRIIIVGFRNDTGLKFKVPIIPNAKIITAKQALTTPPIPTWAKNQEYTKQSQQVIERLQYIKPGENAFNANLPPHLTLNVKGAKISQIYKRLHPDKPSYTVTGSGGGGTHVYHWSEDRALTNRERARLQTFPDSFEFLGSKESVRKQIGMAVPPKGVSIIFDAILKTFCGLDYPSREPNISLQFTPGKLIEV